MSAITDAQRIELENDPNFKNMVKQAVRNYAIYITGQDGTTGSLAGLIPVEWAKRRFIAKGWVQSPQSVDGSANDLTIQFSMNLKGQDVWTTDAATTIAGMVTSGKFDELANLVFGLRAEKIEF